MLSSVEYSLLLFPINYLTHSASSPQIDYMWEDLRKEFVGMDPYGVGFISQDEFRDVLRELCVHLSEYELDQLVRKFDIRRDGR